MPDSWDFSTPPSRSGGNLANLPIFTYLLCALCIVITLAFHTSSPTSSPLWYRIGHFGYTPASEIWEGHYIGLFASFFIHGDVLHLVFNLMWLLTLGRILERTLHPLIYLPFIIAATVVGSGAELAVSGTTGVGASGAVYAMFGLMWAGRGRFPEWRAIATRQNLNLFIGWGIFCVFATAAHFMSIANGAHGAGFVFGLAIGWLFFAPRRQPLWAIPLAAVLGLTVLSLTWLPWSEAWNFWKGNRAFDRHDYRTAIAWYQRSLKLGGDPPSNWYNIGAAWHNLSIQEDKQNHSEEAAKARTEEAIAMQKAGPRKPNEDQ